MDGAEPEDWPPGNGEIGKCEAGLLPDWEPRDEERPWSPDAQGAPGKEGWGEAVPWGMPTGRARTPALGMTKELREGVPDLEGPLKADWMGLLLPLPPPCRAMAWACCSLKNAPAGLFMDGWLDSPELGLGLGALCMFGVERPGVCEGV